MRIKSNEKFYERKSKIHEPRPKHFLIFEGTKSEQIYFETYFKNNNEIANVFFLLRDKDKEGWSNPQKIIDLLNDEIGDITKTNFTYDTIFDNLYDYISQYISVVPKNKIKNDYINRVIKNGEKIDNFIDKAKLSTIFKDLKDTYIEEYKISDIFHDENVLKELIEEQSTFNKSIDKIYLVVDRDKKSFTDPQYDETFKKAIENDIDFYVINPCFEFWLLLHFTDCQEYKKEELLENNYVTKNNTFVYEELKKWDPRYTKTSFDAKMYIDKIDYAIKNSKKFETDIILLKDNVGTNLSIFFDKICKK